jgi:major membrane immunogen (membrane-anchored lipoprotein)
MNDETFDAMCGQQIFGMCGFRHGDAAKEDGKYQEHREKAGRHSVSLAIAIETDKKLLTACRPFYSEVPAVSASNEKHSHAIVLYYRLASDL